MSVTFTAPHTRSEGGVWCGCPRMSIARGSKDHRHDCPRRKAAS